MKTRNRPYLLLLFAAVPALPALAQNSTDIDQVILYGVNNDPPVELLRYAFCSDTLTPIGEIRDQLGVAPPEMEAFTYIPEGVYKGYYASSNYAAWAKSRLVKINHLTAEATTYPVDIGFGFVVGMTAYKDEMTGNWLIYATHRGKVGGVGPNVTNLISIDPATGVGTLVQPILDAATTAYQGLTLGPDGLLYGVTNIPRTTLRTINPATGVEAVIGQMSTLNLKVEALEWAFGESDPKIVIPGVDETWTENGVLFAFSDDTDTFMVVNPATGEWVPYNCAFEATDAEGLAFFTWWSDPRYAVGNGFD